jgi:hypothetical protein
MNLNSPLFDSIRVKREPEPEARPEERVCDHAGCRSKGEFRAPKGRNHEGQFFFFCLEHVKAYNATYNYFNGMSDDAVAAYQKDASIGHRPTWTLGTNAKNPRAAQRGAKRAPAEGPETEDLFGLFENRANPQGAGRAGSGGCRDQARDQDALQGAGEALPPGRQWRRSLARGPPDRDRQRLQPSQAGGARLTNPPRLRALRTAVSRPARLPPGTEMGKEPL